MPIVSVSKDRSDKKEEVTLPALFVSKHDGEIILVTGLAKDEKCYKGVCVKSVGGSSLFSFVPTRKVGHYSKGYLKSAFVPFNGTVTLENKKNEDAAQDIKE
jgi:hypothetical protein